MKDGNPWVQARTLFWSAVDVLRRAEVAMTAREIADALVADKAPQATRKQAIDLQAAIFAALRKRDGLTVIGEGAPARWELACYRPRILTPRIASSVNVTLMAALRLAMRC
jgi:hypothetical protein